MKLNIQIKSIFGSVIFELEKENNTIKDTLVEAAKQGADLRGADLRGADLQGADLRGADLRGAYLRGAYLRGADLRGADLRGADLRGADLRGYKIKSAAVITGLYEYIVIAYITVDDLCRIKLGCYDRSLEEWEADFWNNNNEFPNNNSLKSNQRLLAFETAKSWLKLSQQDIAIHPEKYEIKD